MTTVTKTPSTPPALRRRRRTVGERQLVAAVAVGAVAVLALWWHDTTILAGPGEWVSAAGRITGLLGGYAVAVALLLMCRAPWLDHGLGTDRLARWHAMTGRYLLGLLSAHAVLITWGYSLASGSGLVAQVRLLLVAVPDVLLAVIGYGLLVLVGVLSARQVRRRVGYETWYLVHLLTYVAIGLSFLHVLSAGADFRTGWAEAAWITLYAVVAALLVWYRWLNPVRNALRHRPRVAAVTSEAPGVVSVVVAGRDLDRLGAEAGQFLRWRFLTPTGWWQSHPFSLSAAPTDSELRITVKALGTHSAGLRGLVPGTRALMEGPYGALTVARRRNPGVLLLAGGIGITPLRALLEQHHDQGAEAGPATLVYRARSIEDLVHRQEIDRLAQAAHIDVHYGVGPSGGSDDVLVGERLREVVPDLGDRDVYLCGPGPFMEAATASLRRCGVPARHVHAEHFEL
ncbi:Flavohemoprotein [Nocardioides dokdonensis FR1436]|uniref:Flavohemoprotein n=1 Tax=Nocardioides dokdonensis FR1436 TaxID=1300347 RepID=A0A1A9GQV0_9ACTN|nr:ferredoxin reductase family protein [Nocardioides dokdonensis]ANH40466.1 Flavohemoprotein [Nocardioides dokdonensis FR1436]